MTVEERLPGVIRRKDGRTWSPAERATFTPQHTLQVHPADQIEKRHIAWLWRPYLQRGAINLVTGDPGIGKSTFICEIAAALSTGRALPGADPLPPMNVWIMNGEDSAADTIVWRLENQKADLSRVFITDQVRVIDGEVAAEIQSLIVEHQIGAVFIDPLQAWMGSKLDMNRANETREWAGMLRTVAQLTGVAVVFVRHRRKGAPGDNTLYAGLGSIDISGFARSEIGVLKATSGVTYITRTKGNVGKKGESLAYTIEPPPSGNDDHGIFIWKGQVDAETVNKKGSSVPKTLGKAIEWLRWYLEQGPKPSQGVFEAGIKAGFSEGTIKRARLTCAGTRQVVDGDRRSWYWYLKEDGGPNDNPLEYTIIGTKPGRAPD